MMNRYNVSDIQAEKQQILELMSSDKTIYVEVLYGEYAGSIAKAKFAGFPSALKNLIQSPWCDTIEVKLSWDDHKNKPRHLIFIDSMGDDIYSWGGCKPLLGYKGPTEFVRFDKKKILEEILDNKKWIDVSGDQLSIGDEVIFIDTRYGSAAELNFGTITGFDGKVSQGSGPQQIYSETWVEVRPIGEETVKKLRYPETQVYKKSKIYG